MRQQKRIEIIAEVKTQSPFPREKGWKSEQSWEELFAVANEIGDIISIHTDQRWGGSFDLLEKTRGLTDKPLLAKGIHADDADVKRVLDAGADFVLIVGRIPKIFDRKTLKRFLIEPRSIAELKTLSEKLSAMGVPVADQKFVWNSRDLETGGLKTEAGKAGSVDEIFAHARAVFAGWLCQASNIRTVANIAAGADAMLVGTHLFEFAESLLNR